MDSSQSFNEFLIREYESFLERIEVLERRRRLTPFDFGTIAEPEDPTERVKACMLWRVGGWNVSNRSRT